MDKQLMIQEMLNKEFNDFAEKFADLCEKSGDEAGYKVLVSLDALSLSIHKEADPLKRSMLLAYYLELAGDMLEDSLDAYKEFSIEARKNSRDATKAINEILNS